MSWKSLVAAAGGPLFDAALDVRDRLRCLRLKAPAAPFGTDGVGYETLIAFLERRNILAAPGDLLEIGTRLGGGALKLSRWLEKKGSPKTLHVVDTFALDWRREDPDVENLYLAGLKRRWGGLSQREVFDRVCGGRPNVKVWAADSAQLDAPGVLCFGFVDGSHEPRYVENDFSLVWESLAPGGAIALHDYGWFLPEVTKTIDRLVAEKKGQIADEEVDARKHVLFALKKR